MYIVSMQNVIAIATPPLQPAVSSYNQALLSWATEMLCTRWGEFRLPIPVDMQSPHLSLIHLPSCLGPPTREKRLELMMSLLRRHKVVTTVEIVDGGFWCRYGQLISLYNDVLFILRVFS